MKTTIRDVAVLRSVAPLDVVAYLRTSGWTLQETVPGRYTLWERAAGDAGETFEALVPASAELRDFAQRIADLLATLEVAEGRSQEEVLEDLLTPNADVIRIRAVGPESRDGSLPFEDAVGLVDHAREMLLAAACAAIEPRPWFETRRPSEATEFVRRLRMGQTARGSFVMTIQSRVPPALDGAGLRTPAVAELDPFERRVTHTLSFGLDAMQRAANDAATSGQLDAFRAAVPRGLSANLCGAVAGLAGRAEDQSIEVSFTWARVRPPRIDVPSRIRFAPDALPIIGEAGRVLKEQSPRLDFDLEGPILRLDRSPDEQGTVTIGGFVDGRPRKVRVDLGPEDYRRACDAHREGNIVRCTGTLTRDGRSFVLRDARGFAVVTEP